MSAFRKYVSFRENIFKIVKMKDTRYIKRETERERKREREREM
jgi:hypothetical protein